MAYHPKTLQCLSVLQIVTAVISIFLGIGSAVVKSDFTSYAGFGIWVGLWILVAGVLGYCGSRDQNAPNNCLLGTFMGFTITACVLCGIMFICYCIALGILASALECHKARLYNHNYFIHHKYAYDCHGTTYARAKAGVGIGSVLLIIALLEFFVALTSAIYCCNAVCCGQRTTTTTTQQQTVVFQQQQVMQPSGGVMVVSGSGGAVLQPPPGQVIIKQPAQPGSVTVGQLGYGPPGYALGYAPVYPPGYTTNTTVVAQPPPYSAPPTNVQITHS